MATPSLFPQFMKATAGGGGTVVYSISSLFQGDVELVMACDAEIEQVVEAEVETEVTAEVVTEVTAERVC